MIFVISWFCCSENDSCRYFTHDEICLRRRSACHHILLVYILTLGWSAYANDISLSLFSCIRKKFRKRENSLFKKYEILVAKSVQCNKFHLQYVKLTKDWNKRGLGKKMLVQWRTIVLSNRKIHRWSIPQG